LKANDYLHGWWLMSLISTNQTIRHMQTGDFYWMTVIEFNGYSTYSCSSLPVWPLHAPPSEWVFRPEPHWMNIVTVRRGLEYGLTIEGETAFSCKEITHSAHNIPGHNLRRSPRWTDWNENLHWCRSRGPNHRCQVRIWKKSGILMTLVFKIRPFPLTLHVGLTNTTVQRYRAVCDFFTRKCRNTAPFCISRECVYTF